MVERVMARVRERPLGRHRQGRVSQEEAGAKRMLLTMAGLMLQELKVCTERPLPLPLQLLYLLGAWDTEGYVAYMFKSLGV